MKLSRYISKLLWVLPALMLGACSDDVEPVDISDITSEEGAGIEELTLNLSIPEYEVTEIGSRASANPTETIDNISVFCYGTDGSFLQSVTTYGPWAFSSGKATVTVTIDKKTSRVEVVTNYVAASGDTNPATVFTSASIDPTKPVMWGQVSLSAVAGSSALVDVPLMRNYAKVTVAKAASATGSFTINGFGVSYTAVNGSLAPSSKTAAPTSPTIMSGETYTYNVSSPTTVGASEAVYVYETAADVANADGTLKSGGRVIIQIDGSYYCVAFRTRSGVTSTGSETPGAYSYTAIPIIRNHNYTVNVLEVREAGWSTYEEAMKAAPDNRITVLITDETADVTNITATRDYMLGVSDDLSVVADATTPSITVITSYPGTPQISLSTDNATWITLPTSYGTPKSVSGLTSGTNSTGSLYTIPVTIAANELADARTGTITVTSGLLTRTITVTQAGYDYRRASNRKVQMLITNYGASNSSVTEADYFAWLDNTVQGVLPEENRDQVVNQGLHFPAVPVYNCHYLIPRLSTAETYSISSGFTCTSTTVSGTTYWDVVCTDSSTSVVLSSTDGLLTITNASGVQIKYPLYRRGIFHKIEPEAATTFEPAFSTDDASKLASGWFYYGVAPVGSSNYVLDRNLGASNNNYYAATSSNFVGNTAARGGYFKIATSKSASQASVETTVNSEHALNFKNFRLPLESEFETWVINVDRSNVNGEQTDRYYLSTNSAYFPEGRIYIPAAGYYEGNTQRYETHANLWTQTLLAGNQGFSITSPDFGYWFIYFNGYNGQTTFSNMRFANGASGIAPTANSVYKYMPMRLMYDPNS